MSTEFTTDEGEPILVQFSEARGMQPVSLSGEDLAKKSAEALDKAIYNSANAVDWNAFRVHSA